MSTISTHVLDTARGVPAKGLSIALSRAVEGAWTTLGQAVTDSDGRVRDLLPPGTQLEPGEYRMEFGTGAWFASLGVEGFYPVVRVEFVIRAADQHYHVPLLLSPWGYSTYRGS